MRKQNFLLFSRSNGGFSLAELLIYIGILGLISGALVGILTTTTKTQVEESGQNLLTGELNFVNQTIQRLVRDSSLVLADAGVASTTLTLRTSTLVKDPTLIYLSGGQIYVKEGSASAQTITSDKVIVDSLQFKKMSQPNGKDIVQLDIAMSATQQAGGKTISRAIRTAFSRVNAATFDSDLLPNTDNSYSVGTSPSTRWKNASFSGDLTVGGKIGAGLTSPVNKLDVEGGAAIGATYSGTNSAPTNGMIVEGNLYIGTTGGVGAKLDVVSTGTNASTFNAQDATNGNRFFIVSNLGAGGYNLLSQAGDVGLMYYKTGSSASGFTLGPWHSTTTAFRIDSNGNIGFGTASPSSKVDVYAGDLQITRPSGDTGSAILKIYQNNVASNRGQWLLASRNAENLGIYNNGLGGDVMTFTTSSISVNSKKLTGLATPIDSTDAATKSYVDGLGGSISAKGIPASYMYTSGCAFTTGDPASNYMYVNLGANDLTEKYVGNYKGKAGCYWVTTGSRDNGTGGSVSCDGNTWYKTITTGSNYYGYIKCYDTE